MSENRPTTYNPGTEAKVRINYDEIETRPPPLLEVGALAWIRKNLFGSSLDIFLTIFGVIFIIGALTAFLQWAIQQGNWFVIIFNFRQFMLGRFELDSEWRITVFVLFVAVTIGVLLAAWMRRIGRLLLVSCIVLLLFVFIVPPLIYGSTSNPSAYVTAANVDIVSGSSTEVAQEQVGFIGQAGEEITIELAENLFESDEALANLHGFIDFAGNILRNGAQTRLDTLVEVGQLEAELAEDQARLDAGRSLGTLTTKQREAANSRLEQIKYVPTEEQLARIEEIQAELSTKDSGISEEERTALEAELQGLLEPPTIISSYQLGELSVSVQIVDGDTKDTVTSQVLEPGGNPLTFTLPDDGWYILNKTVEGGDGASLLHMTGIYPIFQQSQGTGDSVFLRMTDNYETVEQLPRIEGEEISFLGIINNQYRGVRPFATYMRVYFAPFLEDLQFGILRLVIAVLIGFYGIQYLAPMFAPKEDAYVYIGRVATWLLIATPPVMFVLINGIGVGPLDFSDPRRWGGLLLSGIITVFGIIFAFPLGIGLALGRRSQLPGIKYLCTMFIELVRGTPFIVVLFMMQLMIPLAIPAFAEIPNVYRALIATVIFVAAYLAENVRGGLQSLPPGQEEAAKALGLSNWQGTIYITLPQALRAVIPALVGQFISMFKDTSLLAIVGLIDLTGVVNTVVVQAEFIGTRRESLLFISIIYFAFCYVMSYVSRQIEASGSGAARRI